MSVRKGDRTQGKLEVLKLATNLATYTLKICRNEKYFPKSQRWLLTQKIVDAALTAMTCIRRANVPKIHNGFGSKEDYLYRRSHQLEAHAHYGALYSLIDLAYNLGYINAEQAETWTELVSDTDDKLTAWMKSNYNDYLAKNSET